MAKNRIFQELDNGYSVQSGVFAVVSDKVSVAVNDFGQYEARFDSSELTNDELHALESVSAMSNDKLNETVLAKKLFSETDNIRHNPILGYYTNLYAGHVTVGDYRANASSGGIGTWLLVQLLERKMIDGVIHVHPTDDGDGILFKYKISNSKDDIKAGAKSRYYPADLSEVLKTVKKSGGRYAITGIPSFITELRLLAEYDPAFKEHIKYTIGLICGHQKTMKYAEALAWQHGIKPGDLKGIDFRKKVPGQPANRYISELTGIVDGTKVVITKDQNELFISNWGHGFFKSKLSDFTDEVFNETADIALGDAWLPQYTADSKGTNIVIVRNNELQSIIDEGLSSGALELDLLDEKTIIKSQSGLVHHNQDELPYRLHKQDASGNWRPIKRFEASSDLPYLRKKVQDIREKIATESHTQYRTAVELGDWEYFHRSMQPLASRYMLIYRLIVLQREGPVRAIKKVFSKLIS